MLRIFKRIKNIEIQMEEQDVYYSKLQNRLSRTTKELNGLKVLIDEIKEELERFKNGRENNWRYGIHLSMSKS